MRYETIYEMDHLQMNMDYYNVLRYGTIQTLSTAKSLKVACKTLKLWTKSYSCFASHFTFRKLMYPEIIRWTQNIRGYVILSVKPFKSKNRDKIDLDAPNPNRKEGCDRDFWATA